MYDAVISITVEIDVEVKERKSFIYRRKNVGPSTDPCGTPTFITLKSEL